ncbi:hypothetical protein [Ruegeria sp. 6PALISEP08]|uniref:hypothetical protein n=1 Tax=Ruegeria sp. 6PALISEP08 TaxID=1225660 RepID=UPI0012EDA472|nr:hypothetical protein [Ruegeria sp. 6PALISEP08]
MRVASAVFSLWKLDLPISLTAVNDAADSVQTSFVLLTFGSTAIVLYIIYAAVSAAMAVPMASAAQEAGYGAPSRGFFFGFGRSFIPLFCVFFFSILLQFYFGLLTALFALLPIFISVISIILTQSLPDFDLDLILKGIAASAALLWLNSWIWSVCALAFLKHSGDAPLPATSPQPGPETATDIRSLRKSRERSF